MLGVKCKSVELQIFSIQNRSHKAKRNTFVVDNLNIKSNVFKISIKRRFGQKLRFIFMMTDRDFITKGRDFHDERSRFFDTRSRFS